MSKSSPDPDERPNRVLVALVAPFYIAWVVAQAGTATILRGLGATWSALVAGLAGVIRPFGSALRLLAGWIESVRGAIDFLLTAIRQPFDRLGGMVRAGLAAAWDEFVALIHAIGRAIAPAVRTVRRGLAVVWHGIAALVRAFATGLMTIARWTAQKVAPIAAAIGRGLRAIADRTAGVVRVILSAIARLLAGIARVGSVLGRVVARAGSVVGSAVSSVTRAAGAVERRVALVLGAVAALLRAVVVAVTRPVGRALVAVGAAFASVASRAGRALADAARAVVAPLARVTAGVVNSLGAATSAVARPIGRALGIVGVGFASLARALRVAFGDAAAAAARTLGPVRVRLRSANLEIRMALVAAGFERARPTPPAIETAITSGRERPYVSDQAHPLSSTGPRATNSRDQGHPASADERERPIARGDRGRRASSIAAIALGSGAAVFLIGAGYDLLGFSGGVPALAAVVGAGFIAGVVTAPERRDEGWIGFGVGMIIAVAFGSAVTVITGGSPASPIPAVIGLWILGPLGFIPGWGTGRLRRGHRPESPVRNVPGRPVPR
jgi:hypothetical protein